MTQYMYLLNHSVATREQVLEILTGVYVGQLVSDEMAAKYGTDDPAEIRLRRLENGTHGRIVYVPTNGDMRTLTKIEIVP